jgi:peptidoglycan/xylan/chitin deacetylase (PgdA/CDA1 family)
MWLGLGLTAAAAGGVIAYGITSPSSQMFGTALCRGKDGPGVSLTFDDGPHPEGTPAVLDALGEAGVKATFFVIGANVRRWPELANRMVREGHEVGNHGFTHSHWSAFGTASWWRRQIADTDDAVNRATGSTPQFFRPPLGLKAPPTMLAARQQNKTVITWTHRAIDGLTTTPERIVSRLVPATRGGDILLLHDGIDPYHKRDTRPTIDSLRPLIAGLRAKGLEVATLRETLGIAARTV